VKCKHHSSYNDLKALIVKEYPVVLMEVIQYIQALLLFLGY
jgi:hypothetical protein